MSYVDRVVQAHGGDEDSDGEDDEDWVEGDTGDGGENDEDPMEEDSEQGQDAGGVGEDNNDRLEEEEEVEDAGESDDELEFDFDDFFGGASLVYFEWGEGPGRMIRNYAEITRARRVQMKLSKEGKEHCTWRLDKDKSFSDWTIVVSSDNGSDDSVEYNVHRHILATGPRKSGYFESMLLSSGQFQEQSSSTSPIELPADIASGFPSFLDYLYAPISEAKYVITPENFAQLRHLSDYFLVPALSHSVNEFIKEDMNCLERTEEYLRMAVKEGLDELVAHAAYVCVRNIRGIKQDSTLLYSMPPAFFWHFIVYAGQLAREQFEDEHATCSAFAIELNKLIFSYMEKHGSLLGLPYFLAVFDQIAEIMPNDCEDSASVVLRYLDLFKRYSWTIDFDWNRPVGQFYCESFVKCCAETIYSHTRQNDLDERQVQSIMSRVPHCIAGHLFVMASKELRGEADSSSSSSSNNSMVQDE